jgi:hypothetical protein
MAAALDATARYYPPIAQLSGLCFSLFSFFELHTENTVFDVKPGFPQTPIVVVDVDSVTRQPPPLSSHTRQAQRLFRSSSRTLFSIDPGQNLTAIKRGIS